MNQNFRSLHAHFLMSGYKKPNFISIFGQIKAFEKTTYMYETNQKDDAFSVWFPIYKKFIFVNRSQIKLDYHVSTEGCFIRKTQQFQMQFRLSKYLYSHQIWLHALNTFCRNKKTTKNKRQNYEKHHS